MQVARYERIPAGISSDVVAALEISKCPRADGKNIVAILPNLSTPLFDKLKAAQISNASDINLAEKPPTGPRLPWVLARCLPRH